MTDYNKFLLAKALSWVALILIMSIVFGPMLVLLAVTWFSDWPTWGTFLFNLGICFFVYIAPNTQYMKEEIEIRIRKKLGVKY